MIVSARVMAVASAAAITALPMLCAGPAWGHAAALSSSPAEGAVLSAAPAVVRVTFNESITSGSSPLAVVKASGSVVSTRSRIVGMSATASMATKAKGRYALVWDIVSEDGHRVQQARGFSVGKPDPAARTETLQFSGVSTTLSGTRVGTRTLRLPSAYAKAIGEVQWRHSKISAPFVWKVNAGTARGMLPFPGTYSVLIKVYLSATAAKTLIGTVRITA